MRRAAMLVVVVALAGCYGANHPADNGPGYSSSGDYPNPTGIYYHVKVDASVAAYYWDVWRAAQKVYEQTGIVLYVDPPSTPPSAAPGSFNVRAEAGVEAGYCGGGRACAQYLTIPGTHKITTGTMLLNVNTVGRNPAGSLLHEFGHLLGLNHYPFYLMQPSVPDWMTDFGPGDRYGLDHQVTQGCAVWGGC